MGNSDKKVTPPRSAEPASRRPATESERRAIIEAMPKVKLRTGETSVGLVREARGGEP